MEKIKMTTPLVEMDGDEMTRIIWKWIKDILINPYVDLKSEYFDLSIQNRQKTCDQVTKDSAYATQKYGVAVKCATITANSQRKVEFDLDVLYPSPNATIRAILDGTVFRAPILIDGITPYIPTWTKPIVIARHAYGDVYKASEMQVKQGQTAKIVVTDGNNSDEKVVFEFEDTDGILQGQYNTDKSIHSFAQSCMNYALETKNNLWFATKDTISKIYDHRFKDIFEEVYNTQFKTKFEEAGIWYDYTLIDDMVARIVRSEGGFIWACKNYDGDVMSDMVATAYGSLAMMTSVLVSPDGNFEFEAAHGTVTRHYYKYMKGETTSTNSCATIFAWSGALRKRGELDGNNQLIDFANNLETATIKTIEEGVMTGDLVGLFKKDNVQIQKVDTKTFLEEIAKRI